MFVFKVQLSHHLVLTQLGWRLIYIFFHRDDCIYNLIYMLTPKKEEKKRKTSIRQMLCNKYNYGFACTQAGAIPPRRMKLYEGMNK